jgi:DNA polymerase gamma 1
MLTRSRPVHAARAPIKTLRRLQATVSPESAHTRTRADRMCNLPTPVSFLSHKIVKAIYNEVGIQMLNRHLHHQIFKNSSLPRPDPRAVVISQEHLRKHGLDYTKSSQVPDIGFDLPPLQGGTIDEHFHRLGSMSAEPWLSFCNSIADSNLPPKPGHWLVCSGWTRYSVNENPRGVPYPNLSEKSLVFDVETLPKYTTSPIIAVAASAEAWYVWLSPWILGESENEDHLVPLGPPSSSRLVVGHNVSFDRARVYEEYSISQTQTRFIDTMSLHIAINGMTSGQRLAWNKFNKTRESEENSPAVESGTFLVARRRDLS